MSTPSKNNTATPPEEWNVLDTDGGASSPLIPTDTTDAGEIVVLGRDLWEFLGVKDRYSTWFRNMTAYGFIAGQDFTEISAKSLTSGNVGRPRKDHILTLSMAKELSMIQRTDKGKQARLYFIECEKKAKAAAAASPAELSRMDLIRIALEAETERLELENTVKELEKHANGLEIVNEALRPKAEAADAWLESKGDYEVGDAAKLLARAGANTGRNRLFKFLWENGWIYKHATDGSWRASQARINQGWVTEKAKAPVFNAYGDRILPAPQIRITARGVARLGIIMELISDYDEAHDVLGI